MKKWFIDRRVLLVILMVGTIFGLIHQTWRIKIESKQAHAQTPMRQPPAVKTPAEVDREFLAQKSPVTENCEQYYAKAKQWMDATESKITGNHLQASYSAMYGIRYQNCITRRYSNG